MEKATPKVLKKDNQQLSQEEYIVDYTIDLMKKWHPNAKIKFLEYTGHNNPVKYQCEKCGQVDERSKGKNFWRSKYACQKCFDGLKKEPEGKIKIIEAFKSNPMMELIEYHGHDKCKVKCLRCGKILFRYAQNILKNPCFCPNCDIPKPYQAMKLEEAQQWLNKITKSEDFQILDFKNTTEKSLIRHSCGFVFKRRIYNFNTSRGCPKCDRKRSLLEKQVESYLIENNFNYSSQKRFLDCNQGRSSYDFCLYSSSNIVLIEVQGQQHYQEVEIFDEDLETVLKRDKLKEEYCLANNILLIKIPYWDIDKIPQYIPIEKFNDYRN